jgi:hypothetical protein
MVSLSLLCGMFEKGTPARRKQHSGIRAADEPLVGVAALSQLSGVQKWSLAQLSRSCRAIILKRPGLDTSATPGHKKFAEDIANLANGKRPIARATAESD